MNALDKEDKDWTFNPSRLRASSVSVHQSQSAPSLWAHGASIQLRPVENTFGLLKIRCFHFERSAVSAHSFKLFEQDQSSSVYSTITKHIFMRFGIGDSTCSANGPRTYITRA